MRSVSRLIGRPGVGEGGERRERREAVIEREQKAMPSSSDLGFVPSVCLSSFRPAFCAVFPLHYVCVPSLFANLGEGHLLLFTPRPLALLSRGLGDPIVRDLS